MAVYKSYKKLSIFLERPGVLGVNIDFDKEEFTIGADPDCDIVLKERGIGKNHAKIRHMRQEGYFQLENNASRNGVLFEGHPIDRLILLNKDEFRLGEVKFTVHLE